MLLPCADYIETFFNEYLVEADDASTKTADVYKEYLPWAKKNGVIPVRAQEFVSELRNRYTVVRRAEGNVVNAKLKNKLA